MNNTIDIYFAFRSLQNVYAIEESDISLRSLPRGSSLRILTSNLKLFVKELIFILKSVSSFDLPDYTFDLENNSLGTRLILISGNVEFLKFDIRSSVWCHSRIYLLEPDLAYILLYRRINVDGVYLLTKADEAFLKLISYIDSNREKHRHGNIYSGLDKDARFDVCNLAANYIKPAN